MKRKSYLSILLALVMLLSLAVVTGAPAFAADESPVSAGVRDQLQLIASQVSALEQKDTADPWYYTVADLDHDGCLEFIAASQHPKDRSTNLKIWSVSKDGTTLNECRLNKAEDESFPDIMTDTVDTYHVKDTDTWYYMVYDNVVISDYEVYTIKTAVSMKDAVMGYEPFAVEHTVVGKDAKNISYTDSNGIAIAGEKYNAAGNDAFAGAARSNTAFEWLTADKLGSAELLAESYEVFMGTKEPSETFPVPKPAALGGPTPTPVPSPTVSPAPQPVKPTWLSITKNPTNENRKVGDNAIFVACANAYDSLSWTFVSPTGGEYTAANFIAGSGATVSGEYSTTITVSRVESWMDGWGAYCTFYFQGQSARTSTAYIRITSTPKPTPTPTPSYSSMSGSAHEGGGGYAINLQNGTQVFVDAWLCNVEGQFYDGCSAVVYYTGKLTSSNIYRADIFGNQGLRPDPTPYYGSMSGSAHEGGGGFAIDLENGRSVFVDAGICTVEGQFYDGCQAIVYYTDSPTSDNIYSVSIFGNQGLIIPDDDPYDDNWDDDPWDDPYDDTWDYDPWDDPYDDTYDDTWDYDLYDDPYDDTYDDTWDNDPYDDAWDTDLNDDDLMALFGDYDEQL